MNKINTWELKSSYSDLPRKFYTAINPIPVKAPKLIIFNKKLAKTLGIDFTYDDKETSAQLFSGIIYQKS